MTPIHIPSEIYHDIARSIEEYADYEYRGLHSEMRTFSLDEEVFETTRKSLPEYLEVSVTGSGVLHYTISRELWGDERIFDSFGNVWLECKTYEDDGCEVLNDFSIDELRNHLRDIA